MSDLGAASHRPARLVYLSPVPLGSFAQRPHHFVQWFHARFGAEVMWIDPYPTRLPRIHDMHRLWRRPAAKLGPAWACDPWIERVSVPSIPLEPLNVGRTFNRWLWKGLVEHVRKFISNECWIVTAKPSGLALELRRQFPECPFAYDVLDNVPAFSAGLSRKWMELAEEQLADQSDWIVTSSSPLYNKFAKTWPEKTRLAKNGFLPVNTINPVVGATTGTPIIGYIGSIASWFDWDILIAFAKKNPNAIVQLIGPCDYIPNNLPNNIIVLPPIPNSDVYSVMTEFSAGLIPFQRNAVTEYVDPIKYYEYRAVGLPILSTKFGEMCHRGHSDGVYFLEDSLDLQSIFKINEDHQKEQDLHKFVQENNWASRFNHLNIF